VRFEGLDSSTSLPPFGWAMTEMLLTWEPLDSSEGCRRGQMFSGID
jgi:hypothetical protein